MHSLSWTVKIQLLSCVSNAWTSKKLFLFFFSFEILLLSSCVSFCLFVCLFFLPSFFGLFFFWNLGAVELCIVWDLLSSPGRRRRPPPSEGERHQITNWSLTTKKQNGRINIFTRLDFWSQALPEPVTVLVLSNGDFETSSDIYWSTAFGHDIIVDKDRYSGHNGWNVICRFLHILHSSQLYLGWCFLARSLDLADVLIDNLIWFDDFFETSELLELRPYKAS